MSNTKLKEAWVPLMRATVCVMDMAIKKNLLLYNYPSFGEGGGLFQFWVPRQLPGLPTPLLADF